MQALIDQYKDAEPNSCFRFLFCFGSGYPLLWSLRKEMARNYTQLGCFASAYEMLKDMELYDEMIQCLFLAGRKTDATEKAKEIILKGGRDVPKILCLLGDFAAEKWEDKEKYYLDAWKMSEGNCPRAIRSLGRLYFEIGKIKEAAEYLEKALKINTLYPSSWFTLGCCYLKLQAWEKALYAFGWVVQVDENSSDGWSNLAISYTQLGKLREAVSCYEQALKIARDSWKIWQNYIILSLDIPDVSKTMGAIRQLMAMDLQERIPIPFLARLVNVILALPDAKVSLSKVNIYEEQVLKLINDMCTKDSVNTPLWGLYADTYEIIKIKNSSKADKKEEYNYLIDVLLKQCRSLMHNPNWDHFEYIY